MPIPSGAVPLLAELLRAVPDGTDRTIDFLMPRKTHPVASRADPAAGHGALVRASGAGSARSNLAGER